MGNKKIAVLTFTAACLVAMTGCGRRGNSSAGSNGGSSVIDFSSIVDDKPKHYTYNTYSSVMPSNWNELTYQDNNDTAILSYISGSFFGYDFKFDDKGNVKKGEFQTVYEGATNLEDCTTDYAGNKKYSVPATATKGYAYKISLREDLKWDDGTAIKAEDFIYTMQEQLNPKFKNYRADSYYNSSIVIHNARDYVYQGNKGWFDSKGIYGGVYNEADDSKLVFDFGDSPKAKCYFMQYVDSKYAKHIAAGYTYSWFLTTGFGVCTQADIDNMQGKTLAEIKANANSKASWETLIGNWQTDPGEELDFFISEYEYPEVKWENVGMFADGDYDIVLVLDKPIVLLDYDANDQPINEGGKYKLNYQAAYYLSSLPLVKKDLYEKNKHEPSTTELWTSTYNQSVESTASWGPYKLTYFQAAKQYILEKNDNWYGKAEADAKGQYQCDKIQCDLMADYKTAWLAFQKGDLATIGVDVSIAADYKRSSRAVYTGDDYINSMQLQSNKDALKAREEAGVNKTILANKKFRKALSLAVDRADYVVACTTACLPGYGIFNDYHYYDVANGGVYRNTDQAKKVICETYGVDWTKYPSLDDAYDAVTGYNLKLARQLVDEAVEEAIAAGDMKAGDKVVLDFGTSADTEATRRNYDYFKKAFAELAKETKIDGKFDLTFSTHDSNWATDFRAGGYDICLGGWSGAAWDPGYFLLAYLSPDYMYSTAWDTYSVLATYDPDGDGTKYEALTMTLMQWYNALNGIFDDDGAKVPAEYNWAEGMVDTDFRLGIIAMLEGQILQEYYTVPLYNYYSATLVSYKVDYITKDYNTFMGYGGIRYMHFNYDDDAWEGVKASFADKYKA